MRGRIGIGIRIRVGIVLWFVGVVVPGCASTSDARYVYQDGEFGVVAIPKNTPQGPHHYREQAEALMAQHFPQGYEIVRAEEVVEGARTLTVGRTGSTELAPQVTPHLFPLLKVGGSMTRSQADTLNLTECRIIYKKADPRPAIAPAPAPVPGPVAAPTPGGFALEASLSPTCYLDPNSRARKENKEPVQVSHAKEDHHATRTGESHLNE